MSAELRSPQTRAPVPRREERKDANWIATIRLSEGTEIPCNVKDISKSGARLGIPARQELPETFMLRVIGRDFLFLMRLARRRGDYASVRIERVGKAPASAPQPSPASSSTPARAVPNPVGEPGGVGARSRDRGLSSF